MGNIISDCGSKYHKVSKFIGGTLKRIYPYRPSLNTYDRSYKKKYPIVNYFPAVSIHPDWEKPWGNLNLIPDSDLLAVDCVYYAGVR